MAKNILVVEDEHRIAKMVRIAGSLGAKVIGDEGETYELRRPPFGRERIVSIPPDA